MRATLIRLVLGACVLLALVQMQWTNPLTWDEIEYFRATKWTGEGRVPYRDFWEHHTPLQWLVFAPVAKVLGGGAGAGAVLAMRWAQVPLWIGALFLLGRLAVGGWRLAGDRVLALALLLSTPSFLRTAVQYRVDTLGSLALVGALVLALSGRWLAFGAVMSLGVLSNMRLAPLAVVAAVLVVLDRREWRVRMLKIAAGVAIVAAAFVGSLVAAGAWGAFVESVLDYNRTSNELAAPLAQNTFVSLVLTPFREGEVSGIALWVLAGAGLIFAPRKIAALWIVALAAAAFTAVQYDYHLQSAWLLMVPLAAVALERLSSRLPRLPQLAAGVVLVALLLAVVGLVGGSFGGELEYQDLVMKEVDRRVPPGGRVWDGTGYALRREPAYRYWFLPAGVRLMAQRGLIERYDIRANPPAAIVHNYRTHNWMRAFPAVGAFATTHYVPLYRNLWVPGFSAAVPAGGLRARWTAVAGGTYEVWASPLLARHPWLVRPLDYGLIEGPDAPLMAIPLDRLPPEPRERMQWVVDDVPVRGRTLTLRRGSRVELHAAPGAPAGVLVVPAGTRVLCVAPPEKFVF